MNTEGGGDRLSNLSEDLIIKILSYNDTKNAIKTSILSSRWKNTWKLIPHLDLSTDDVTSLTSFQKFTRVLSNRNDEIDLASLKLSVRGGFRPAFLKTVVDHAFSNNSLKDLTLIGCARNYNQPKIKSSFDLPALTTLHLENVILDNGNRDEDGGLLSKCLNLKNLTLLNCNIDYHYPFISPSECFNLSNHINEIELSSVKLGVGRCRQAFLKTVVDYAFSNNVQKMTIIWLDDMHNEIPNFLFMSPSLKDLIFIGSVPYLSQPEIKSSFDLPALTTLYLENVGLSNINTKNGGLFFKCLNLKNLNLFKCSINDHNNFISHSEFSNLTPEKGLYSFANVVAPHLKNLNVVDCQGRLQIYAPELSSLMYEIPCYDTFFANGLSCLEKVDFYMCPFEEDGGAIIKILQQFRSVKYLTLGLEIVEVLELYVDILCDLPSPFANLTSLKIFPRRYWGEMKVKISRQVFYVYFTMLLPAFGKFIFTSF
ncbi:uncharacterized protein [Rutidosis leptorrhynchoides]|uniref:uncharacterized protein n=1 Tax=Rutidosis leptorrhynchoides TaxID=125765 RepID=UPI003A99620F